MSRPLSLLLLFHAVLTAAAGVVLIAAPEKIPATVGIQLDRSAYLICYLLGAAEIAMAFLSFRSRRLADEQSIRLIVSTFILFHLVTAGVELYALGQVGSKGLWGNVALRVVVSMLFLRFMPRGQFSKNGGYQNPER